MMNSYPEYHTNLRESITVPLSSCLFCLDSAALLMLNEKQFYLFGQIQTSQTGDHVCSYTSPYGECSLIYLKLHSLLRFTDAFLSDAFFSECDFV